MEEVTSDVAHRRGGNSHYIRIVRQWCAVAKQLADAQWLNIWLNLRIVAILFFSRHSSRATSGRVAFSVRYVLNTFMSCDAENGNTPYF